MEVNMDDILFEDRHDAGRQLAARISQRPYANELPVVLGIPRGGSWWPLR